MDSLSATVVWLAADEDEDNDSQCSEFKKWLHSTLGVQIRIWGDEYKHHNIVDTYEEPLKEFDLQIFQENSLQHENPPQFLRRLCQPDDDRQPDCWLYFNDPTSFHKGNSLLVPSHQDRRMEGFAFGTICGLSTFVQHYSTEWSQSETWHITQLTADFFHDCQKIRICFYVANSTITREEKNASTNILYRFCISYENISRILVNLGQANEPTDLYLQLRHPILLQRHGFDADEWTGRVPQAISMAERNEVENWIRVTDIDVCPPGNSLNKKELPKVFCSGKDVAMSNVVKLSLKGGETWNLVKCVAVRCENIYTCFCPMQICPAPESTPSLSIPNEFFPCLYALRCLMSCSYQVTDQLSVRKTKGIGRAVNRKLGMYAVENAEALERALYEIYYSLGRDYIILFERALDSLYRKYVDSLASVLGTAGRSKDTTIVQIRCAIVTPTRKIFLPPQPYFKSRLLRLCDPEYALRVQVRDETHQQLSFTMKGTDGQKRQFFNETIKKQLLHGLKVGKRCYRVMGCSVSQLREHGITLYAEDTKGNTAETIRNSVGDLSKIKNPSKYMARIGQAFSQSMKSIPVPQAVVEFNVPDITDGFNPISKQPYIFSDGIGKISPSIASKVYEETETTDKKPSAMQVRYAGCKGMLVVDPTLKSDKIVFRKSMTKFQSDDTSLEIVKFSEPRVVFLNRPFITILEHLGVERCVFLELQKEMLIFFINSLIKNDECMKLLIEYSLQRFPFKALHAAGIQLTSEPFFRALAKAIVTNSLFKLKQKSRIRIPPAYGRTMFGVLDESNTLKYGQIYVQYTKHVDHGGLLEEETIVLTGEVLVTKNPCMHPGDVRKFQAVDVPDLKHIRDCIVFPRNGQRPHPDEMAGSDLDGDEYSVIWMNKLLFDQINEQPMHFPWSSSENTVDGEITVEHMVAFFCDYIQHDIVGIVGSAHLAWADYKEEGVSSRKCRRIAQDFAVVLDFAKSGQSIEFRDYAFQFPDFMEKLSLKSTYLSTRVLGELYRNVKCLEMAAEESKVRPVPDPDLLYPGREHYAGSAKEALRRYRLAIRDVGQQYGIESEGELFSGCLDKASHFQAERNSEDLMPIVQHHVKRVLQNMQQYFNEGFEDGRGSAEERKKKASAWYEETYAQSGESSAVYGLPWVVAEELGSIKRQSRSRNRGCCGYAKRLDSELEDFGGNCSSRLELACHVLDRWSESLRKVGGIMSHSSVKREILQALDETVDVLSLELDDNRWSPSAIVFHTLQTLVCRMFDVSNQSGNAVFSPTWRAGRLALAYMNKIAQSGSMMCLRPGACEDEPFFCRTETQFFRIPLYENTKAINVTFNRKLAREPEQIIKLLKAWTDVKEVDIRLECLRRERKKDRDDSTSDMVDAVRKPKEKWFAVVSVVGSKWCIDQLKSLVVKHDFRRSVVMGRLAMD